MAYLGIFQIVRGPERIEYRNVRNIDLFEFNDGCEMTKLSRTPSRTRRNNNVTSPGKSPVSVGLTSYRTTGEDLRFQCDRVFGYYAMRLQFIEHPRTGRRWRKSAPARYSYKNFHLIPKNRPVGGLFK